VYEPAPAGRSKKRKPAQAAPKAAEETVLLGEEIQRGSERLRVGTRPVRLSEEDKAPQMVLDDKGLQVSSTRGYRTVRATHGAHVGTWYFEVRVDSLGKTGACRLGWATRQSELQAPVGVDENSFAYRSREGCKVCLAWRILDRKSVSLAS
jgi:Set1/Ash2 histone methyltransferase complex subunit ASH2